MIEAQLLAQAITNGLNAIQNKYNFILSINSANYQPTAIPEGRNTDIPTINGIVLTQPGTITPIKNLNNFYVPMAISLAVPKRYADDVFNIFSNFVAQSVGNLITIGEYTAIVNFDVPSVGVLEIMGGVGNCLPIHTTAYFNMFKGGVAASSIQLKINGEDMLFYNFNIVRVKEGERNSIQNEEEMGMKVERQMLSFDITIPYKDSPVVTELVRDALDGGLEKTYTLTYSDKLIGTRTYTVVATSILPAYVAGMLVQISLKFETAQ